MAQRDAAKRAGLPDKEALLESLGREVERAEKDVHEAKDRLGVAKKEYDKFKGDHERRFDDILLKLGIRRQAYFGHAYVGKMCKVLSTQAVACAITTPFLLPFVAQKKELTRLRHRVRRHKHTYRPIGILEASQVEYDTHVWPCA